MPYALYTNDDERISRVFPTRDEVWQHADEAGLVVEVVADDGHVARRELDQDYSIRACVEDCE